MIDRLELKTSRYGHFIESRDKRIPKGISQLIDEDDDLKEIKRSDLNPLYRESITHTVLQSGGVPYEDPVKFYIFVDPRFNKQMTDKYKIAFNPNKTPIGEVMDFLFENFAHSKDRDEIFLDDFKIGRIDFNVDIETHSVNDIFRTLFFDRKTILHTALYACDDEIFDTTFPVRTINRKYMETFYIGKGMYLLRVYDKVREAKHRIQVLKANDMPIPDALKELSEKKQVTRIEIQIRDLNKSGIKKVDTRTGETNIFSPTRRHQNVRTFNDLLHIKPDQFDIFSDLHFKAEQYITMARETRRRSGRQDFLKEQWVIESFNSHIQNVGLDTALKQLPSDTRRELKRRIKEKSFIHDLNNVCLKEVQQWLQN
jgi:hypothetical protein